MARIGKPLVIETGHPRMVPKRAPVTEPAKVEEKEKVPVISQAPESECHGDCSECTREAEGNS